VDEEIEIDVDDVAERVPSVALSVVGSVVTPKQNQNGEQNE
jgi:hypothetical protein